MKRIAARLYLTASHSQLPYFCIHNKGGMAKTMVSWQAFPFLPPSSRAPPVSLPPKTLFPFPFKRLPRRLEFATRNKPDYHGN